LALKHFTRIQAIFSPKTPLPSIHKAFLIRINENNKNFRHKKHACLGPGMQMDPEWNHAYLSLKLKKFYAITYKIDHTQKTLVSLPPSQTCKGKSQAIPWK